MPDLEFWLVWKGAGTMDTGERSLDLYPGFCSLMRPGGIYDAVQDESDPLGITFIHFDVIDPRGGGRVVTRKACRDWPEFFWIEDLAFFDAASRRIMQRFRQFPAIAEAHLRGLLADLFASPLIHEKWLGNGETGAHRRRILKLADDLRSGVIASNTSVAWMAAEAHLSASHFSRLFREVTGETPMQFLLQIRLSWARYLLRETDLGVGEIADQLGYNDLYFFSRQFTQKHGISPTRYREQQAAKASAGSHPESRPRWPSV